MNQIIEFSSNHPYLVGLAVVMTILLIANEIRLLGRRGIDVSPAETVTLMNNGARVLDVRSMDLFRNGHILDAIHIPLDELTSKAESKFKAHRDKFIVVYCDTGIQSAKACAELRQQNFKAVNLRGGLTAWKSDDLPVEKK